MFELKSTAQLITNTWDVTSGMGAMVAHQAQERWRRLRGAGKLDVSVPRAEVTIFWSVALYDFVKILFF
jgi:hypothetical protein